MFSMISRIFSFGKNFSCSGCGVSSLLSCIIHTVPVLCQLSFLPLHRIFGSEELRPSQGKLCFSVPLLSVHQDIFQETEIDKAVACVVFC